MNRSTRRGFGRADAIVLLCIVGFLFLLLPPAILKSRDKARGVTIENEVRKVRLDTEVIEDEIFQRHSLIGHLIRFDGPLSKEGPAADRALAEIARIEGEIEQLEKKKAENERHIVRLREVQAMGGVPSMCCARH